MSAYLRNNHHYDDDLAYRLENLLGSEFATTVDKNLLFEAFELIKKINWFVKEYPDELRWGGGIKRYYKEIEKLKSLKK